MQKIIVEQGGLTKELSVENNYSTNGWTAIFANVADGARVVQKIIDLVGGTGTKPNGVINKYMGASGLVSNIADATNIKGADGSSADITVNDIAAIDGNITLTAADVGADAEGAAAQALEDANAYTDEGLALKLDITAYNEHYKGTYTSLGQLQTAHTTANAGDYALVDAGTDEDAHIYIWDTQDGWVQGNQTSLLNTDSLPEGSLNKYFTNARVKEAFIREDVTFAAAALASNATTTNTVNIASRYQLLQITTNYPCRVRLYTSTAKRDADLTRPIGTDPEGNHGLLFEFISTSELLSADLSPVVDGFADTAAIPYSITNLSNATQTITVTLNHVKTGA